MSYDIRDLGDLRGENKWQHPLGPSKDVPSETADTLPDLTVLPMPDNGSEREAWFRYGTTVWGQLTEERGRVCAPLGAEVWKQTTTERVALLELIEMSANTQGRTVDYRQIMQRAAHVYNDALIRWQNLRETRLKIIPEAQWDDLDRAFDRAQKIAAFGAHYQIISDNTAAGFLKRGFENGALDVWDFIEAGPRAFKDQVGREPTYEESLQLARSAIMLSTKLAATNIALEKAFCDLLRHMNAYTADMPEHDARVRPEYLVVRQELVRQHGSDQTAMQWVISINPDVFHRLTERLNGPEAAEYLPWITENTVGCSMFAARGADTSREVPQSVLREYLEWSYALAVAAIPRATQMEHAALVGRAAVGSA